MHFNEPVDGRMKNCCVNGLYAELAVHFKTGTVLVVRTTGSSCGYSREEGFRRTQEGKPPGVGKMLGYSYSLHDNTFEASWEMAN